MSITFGIYIIYNCITCAITVIKCFWPGKTLSENMWKTPIPENSLAAGSSGSVTAHRIFGDD